MFSNRKTFLHLGALALLGVTGLRAQAPAAPAQPVTAPAAETVPDLQALQAEARAVEAKLPSAVVLPQTYFDLSPVQRDRWRKFLPQTLLKLTRRERVEIVVLGDAILDGAKSEDGVDPVLKSFAGVFAKKLAAQFYYTGGVRVIRPDSKLRDKESKVMGPEILIQPVRTSSIISAASALSTVGFQGQPDVVLVAQGLEDGLAGVSAADVAVAFRSLLDTARGKHLEVIVAGPIPQAADPEEASLALTRGPSSVLREASAKADVIFSDMGDLSRLLVTPPGAKGADQIFPALMQEYQSHLNLRPSQGVMTPTTAMHAEMGRILYQDVMQGAPAVPWKISAAKATLAGQGKLTLEFELANTRREPLAVTLLPLVPAGFKPMDTNPELQLAAGAKQTVKLNYAITDTRQLPLTDGEMRLPILMVAGKQSRIEDIVVPLRPFSIIWNSRAAFNQETEFSPELEIENSTGSKLSATWMSDWAGKAQEGKVALDASGSEVLKLALPLPSDAKAPFRRVLPLRLALSSNSVRQIFDRDIEITRNMGLKESVPMTAADGQESAVTLRADADSMKLFLTLDLTGVSLVDDSSGKAFELLLNLDARSYGERLTPGATAALRISGKAADGAAVVDPIAPWAFGSGYAAVFEPKEFQAELSSSAGGGRRLTITLPKSYLYRHEWALGNGNSQMGLNVRFSGGGRDYFLTRSRRQGDDAESLSVLELTDKPTQRWTVRVE
ncbi:MAG: hypothetical protein K9N47_22560 [Prosthecobacter sp.]|uniref:hypothetical protein n=1 Tax=Prosthecobacter sp. TaxID=1965333 RepID=UPI0026390843|nr:hypothetical protein [Prosthecobacter sp.]MCF7788925.1 hypothetical protein [Prosthecobacter sp.]